MNTPGEERSPGDWGAVAARDGTRVFAAVRPIARDDDAAWDCVQDALLTAVVSRRPDELRDPVEWLCGVARNHARHHVRARRRFLGFLDRLAARVPREATALPIDDREALRQALGTLPAALRDAVILRHIAGMSIAEVATTARVSEAAAKTRIHRGLGRLRRILGGGTLAALLTREAAAGGAERFAALATATAALSAKSLLLAAALLVTATATLLSPGRGAGNAGMLPHPPASAALAMASLLPAVPPVRPAAAGTTLVRDLADGMPRAGLSLRFGSQALTSDADGRIPIGTASLGNLEVTTPGYALLAWIKPGDGAEPVAFVYGMQRLRGTVRTVGGRKRLDPTQVTLRLEPAGDPGATVAAPTPEPRNARFLARWLHNRLPDLPPPSPDGSFDVEVPAIRGLSIMAGAEGYRPGVAWMPVGGDATVELALRPAIRYVGALLRDDGLPQSGVLVEIAVTVRAPPEEFSMERLRHVGHAYTATCGKGGGRVTYLTEGRTAPDGRFEVFLNTEGEGVLVAHPGRGFAPVYRNIGHVARDTIGLVIETCREEAAPRVILRQGGEPLERRRVRVTNRTFGGSPQPKFEVTLDAEGRISTAWLIRDHRYRIEDTQSSLAGEFVWEEQDIVDLAPVPGEGEK